MKTYETEKGNIPEGATHTYELASSKVGYYKLSDGNCCFWSHENSSWYRVTDDECFYDAKPIPQTKEVEWVNGDRCIYDGSEYTFVGMTPAFNSTSCILFDKKMELSTFA